MPNQIQIGDKLKRRISVYDEKTGGAAPRMMTVEAEATYIHPQRRFYTLELHLPSGHRYRETEYFD